ncbi:hypothetical protein MHU86_20086 [Fragilaria crotonensis]|nr:hypothetical protein MHU86_20086 [Fragilaria crotonensis]
MGCTSSTEYGGGNALVLVDGPTPSTIEPQHGQEQPLFISVTLPSGVNPGDTIHVQAPDGRLNAIIVPPGMYAGSTFTVQFDAGPPPVAPPPATAYKYENPPVAPSAPVDIYEPAGTSGASSNGGPDDFVSGFGNSGRRY